MKPANNAQPQYDRTRLLVIAGSHNIIHTTVGDLVHYLHTGDVLVVNNSATLPSSFTGTIRRSLQTVEIRLAAYQGPNARDLRNWLAISFAPGDWRQQTEQRTAAPDIIAGDQIVLGDHLIAQVDSVRHHRLLSIQFLGPSLHSNLYRSGKPIQYAYHKRELNIWDQQTLFSSAPISVEPASAAFSLTWDNIFRLQQKGVKIVSLMHSAGLSSTGCAALDKLLPLPEWYDIPKSTASEIQDAIHSGRRIVAVGTTVLRALESAAQSGSIRSGCGLANIKITAEYNMINVNTLITGMHELGTSHREILNSLQPQDVIINAYQQAENLHYRSHEYGDICLLM